MIDLNGQAPQVVAQIQIVMLDNGAISCQFSGSNRDMFNMMMARASQDMIPILQEKEKQKVVLPGPVAMMPDEISRMRKK